MGQSRRILRSLRVAIGLSLALAAAGCESLEKLNPFEEHKKPLPGARQPVFPEGVPGVDYSSGPGQPSNSNAAIDLPNPPAAGSTPSR
ncbi:hypothetical protein [Xanthobacter agilis]|uniref:Lipoprotein n=1 Tax=Xanthobacter agilis TaxID=47492 RepID=A0ABU0LC30_XANAG|nr:hypothetical protein [Xanthobacter agilis]MDQ0504699.1 hypothetical protein [Xanthobacter agilis]